MAAFFMGRNAVEKIALALVNAEAQKNFPSIAHMHPRTDLILISDFIEPLETIFARIKAIAQRDIRGHLVQIVDPVEEYFPYGGRIEFSDPKSAEVLTVGNAQSLKSDYENLFKARNRELAEMATRMGWSHMMHHTDRPIHEILGKLSSMLTDDSRFV